MSSPILRSRVGALRRSWSSRPAREGHTSTSGYVNGRLPGKAGSAVGSVDISHARGLRVLQRSSRASLRPPSERSAARPRPAMTGLAGRAQTLVARSRSETSTGLVHGRPAATQSGRVEHPPQVASAQVSYSIHSPLIARLITSCWICSVPSKMSMVSRFHLAVPHESVTCDLLRSSPSGPPDSAEF